MDRYKGLLVRHEYDRETVDEVGRVYFWERLDWSKIEYAVDIGAHIGAWSHHLKARKHGLKIAGVEVDKRNAVLHGMNHMDVFLINARCGYKQGDYVLGQHPFHPAAHAVYLREQIPNIGDGRTFVDIPRTVTLEDVMTEFEFPRIDLLKLDCEGAEHEIVAQMADETLAGITYIVGEIHSDFTLGELRLKGAGFKIEYEPHEANPTLQHFFAWRPA
jgi:FkbM family methyltransferase